MKDYFNVKGRIFDIQRYSIHDGVGIRTIVFFKGCALRCRWCCNPESQSFDIETMMVNGKKKVIGKDVTAKEVLETVRRDMPYYTRSDGGLTLSGGECMLQPDFAKALLQGAKEMGVNTAIESTAIVQYETIEQILPYLDTYLMDIKHMDSAKHKEYTGVENYRILENAQKIAKSRQTELVIRVPVIPGFNDTEQEILDIATFADKLPGVRKIHLLPYHSFGRGKYEGLNREYGMGNAPHPEAAKMQNLKDVVEKNTALYCVIGG